MHATSPLELPTKTAVLSLRVLMSAAHARLIGRIAGGFLLGTVAVSANAGSLINSTDYLQYALSDRIYKICAERDNCPEIEVEYLSSNHDWINKAVNARVNNVVVNSQPSESKPVTEMSDTKQAKMSIDAFVNAQFESMSDYDSLPYTLMVTPEYIGHVDNFELFEINAYTFTGGAHGMPFSEYLVFDTQTKRQVVLSDMIVSGKQSTFEALAYEAYKEWVGTVDEEVKNYEKDWPFFLSDNVTLSDKGVDIRYQHYDIGSYAYGMPALSISYSKLKGVLDPYFMPKPK